MIAASGAHRLSFHVLALTIPGALLLIGLWTPAAGVLAALLEAWNTVMSGNESKQEILLICVCTAIAMLGPGCWSIDSVLFGRRRLDLDDR